MVEATVRPVFQRQRVAEPPQFKGFVDATAPATTVTNEIRPPAGTNWSINYLQILTTAVSSISATLYIQLNNGTDTFILKRLAAGAVGDEISFGAFGNGPLIVSRDRWVELVIITNAGSGSFTTHSIAAYEVV